MLTFLSLLTTLCSIKEHKYGLIDSGFFPLSSAQRRFSILFHNEWLGETDKNSESLLISVRHRQEYFIAISSALKYSAKNLIFQLSQGHHYHKIGLL